MSLGWPEQEVSPMSLGFYNGESIHQTNEESDGTQWSRLTAISNSKGQEREVLSPDMDPIEVPGNSRFTSPWALGDKQVDQWYVK